MGWLLYKYVVNTSWFESFVMLNILLIGCATGMDLEYEGELAGGPVHSRALRRISPLHLALPCQRRR